MHALPPQAKHVPMLPTITPQTAPCDATVQGIDLREPLAPDTLARLRQAWLAQQVLAFPRQDLSLDDLERIALHF